MILTRTCLSESVSWPLFCVSESLKMRCICFATFRRVLASSSGGREEGMRTSRCHVKNLLKVSRLSPSN